MDRTGHATGHPRTRSRRGRGAHDVVFAGTRTVSRMLLPSTRQPTICASFSVLKRFVLTIMLERSDGTSAKSASLVPMLAGGPSQEDLLLLIADGAAGSYDLDRIRLMKAAFLVDQKGPEGWAGTFAFRPYTYGPFDSDIYIARDALVDEGLLSSEPGRRYHAYKVTDAARSRLADIERKIGKPHADWVRGIGLWVTERSFSSLIQSIYAEYPAYAEHSALVRK